MIVCKFGGTSVGDAAAIRRLVAIVGDRLASRPMVVVSALSRITDALLALETTADAASFSGRVETILERHREVAAELAIPPEAMDLIAEAARALTVWGEGRAGSTWSGADHDFVASHGELWSSRIVAAALQVGGLPAVWIDAREIIVTDGHHTQALPDQPAIARHAGKIVTPLIEQGSVPITQGFIGRDATGATTTLGRGGSDYTAALLGAALGAERVEIWTDVDGILSADPRIVPDARHLTEASYHEAAELAAFGAKVLHPATQLPLAEAQIPCWVLNSFAPERPGTRIIAGARPNLLAEGSPVRSIAWKKGITVVNVRAPRSLGAVGFLVKLFEAFARHGIAVDVLASSEVSVSVTIEDSSRLPDLVHDLERLGTVSVFDKRAIVAVVGVDLRGTRGLSGRLFNAVRDVNIEVISQGASEINVTFVVREEDAPDAVRALHREFFDAA